ncbi:MAG: thioesterase family protein [Candidatus Methanomethylophilaceae archaeon]
MGTRGEITETVTEEMTAIAVGSGTLQVFGTPAVAALMEKTAYTSVIDQLEPGTNSVGAKTEMDHLAPTPLGSEVTCVTELTDIDRRVLTFEFSVRDAVGEIAKGRHTRVIVDTAKFLDKASKRV